jgi:hypothetical protein
MYLLPCTFRRLSGRLTGYLSPRWSFSNVLGWIIHEAVDMSREGRMNAKIKKKTTTGTKGFDRYKNYFQIFN